MTSPFIGSPLVFVFKTLICLFNWHMIIQWIVKSIICFPSIAFSIWFAWLTMGRDNELGFLLKKLSSLRMSVLWKILKKIIFKMVSDKIFFRFFFKSFFLFNIWVFLVVKNAGSSPVKHNRLSTRPIDQGVD